MRYNSIMDLSLAPIEQKDQWETFLLAHRPQALFQSWQWGEVEKKLGAKVWRWGWFHKQTLVGVAQIQKVTAKRGTFLHVRHGPIGNINFQDLKKLAIAEGAWFIRVSPQVHVDTVYKKLGFTPAAIHEVDAECCWVLDIDKTEEELLMGMRKTTRYEIKRAQKMDVKITKNKKADDFFSLYNQTSERQNFVRHGGINEELEIMDSLVFTATHESRPIASAIILFRAGEAIYHHGASVPNKVGASYLVQWEAILEAKKRGKKLYNFWGIAPEDNPNHPWRGITLFKKGFGGREVNYIHAQDFAISPLYIIPKIIEEIRRRWRGY